MKHDITLVVTIALSAIARQLCAFGLTLPPAGFALGEIRPGEAVSAALVVSNALTRAVAVSRVKACCGGEATLDPMTVPAGGTAILTLKLKPQIPGEIAKSVVLYCDDPVTPIVEIPVAGRIVETDEVRMTSGAALATIVVAGFVDGFNPCSFAIMISLAGILAIGGRRDIAAIGALGLMGERSDADLVRSALDRGGSRLRPAVEAALARIEGRFGGVP